ncbi:MAG: T9SS type A sorting domain-containing protein [Flavobacterium sp.]
MRKTLLFLLTFCSTISFAQGTCATAVTVESGNTYNTGVINGTHIGGCFTGTVPANGKWYTFTTTSPGFMRVNTNIASNPVDGDSRISVFTGTCAALTCVAANDDVSETNYLSDLEFVTTANTTYYIQFDNRWGVDANNLNFEFTHVNGDCSNVSVYPYAKGLTSWKPEFACFTVFNASPTTRTWGWNNVNDVNGNLSPDQIINIFPPATAEIKNDWLFTKPFSFTEGNSYEVSIKFNSFNLNPNDLFPNDNIELFILDAPSSTATLQQSIYLNNAFAPATATVGALYSTAYNGVGTFVPSSTGTYYIGIKGSSTVANRTVLMLFDLNVSETLTINENKLSTFSIFPNPTYNSFSVSNDNNKNIQQISILDINGRLVKTFGANQNNYDISDLNTGIYMVEIKSEVGIETKKLIKK